MPLAFVYHPDIINSNLSFIVQEKGNSTNVNPSSIEVLLSNRFARQVLPVNIIFSPAAIHYASYFASDLMLDY